MNRKKAILIAFLAGLMVIACGKNNDVVSQQEYDEAVARLSELQDQINAQNEENQKSVTAASEIETVDLVDDSKEEEVGDKKTLEALFNVNNEVAEDYINVTSGYGYYSDGDKFSFYYPYGLFNKVEKSGYISGVEVDDATVYSFSGSEGSTLTCAKMTYKDEGKGIETFIEEYISNIYEVTVIADLNDGDGTCKVYTGYEDEAKEMIIYCVIRVDKEAAYVADARFPQFSDDEDGYRKNYYTECIYRGAGFAITKKNLRTYNEFCNENGYTDEVFLSKFNANELEKSIKNPYLVEDFAGEQAEVKYSELEALNMAKNYAKSRGITDYDQFEGGAGNSVFEYECYNENETDSMHPVIFIMRGTIDLKTGQGTAFVHYEDEMDVEVDYTQFDY